MSSVPMPGTEGLAHHQLDQDQGQDRSTIPFTGQLTNIAPFIAAAARHVCPDDVDAEEVARLAVERFSSIGALEHGDAMFHLTPEQLLDEEVAEYADAVIYRARRLAITTLRTLVTSHQLTDEQVDRIREQWRTAYEGGATPIVLHPFEPISVADLTSGYDEDNRAEALHPQQGDA